jgi:hypothetical protein
MASTQAKAKTERAPVNAASSVETLTSGDLTLTLNRQQWTSVLGGLTIAAAESAQRRNYDQMIEYNGICTVIGQKIGGSLATATGGDSSPPLMARAAGAS